MKRKILWPMATALMVLSLVMTACGQAEIAPTTPPTATPTTPTMPSTPTAPTPERPQQEVMKPAAEVPKYGGKIILGSGTEMTDFDEIVGFFGTAAVHPMRLTNEELWIGDWSRGPAGTNEVDWKSGNDRWDFKVGAVAESWDFSRLAEGIMVFKIRKGIHWALNPQSEASRLVGGRELTVDDVIFTMKQHFTDSRAYIYRGVPALRTAEVSSPEPWTMMIKIPPSAVEECVGRIADCIRIVPPEVVRKYGDMTNWRNSVGTGPFMLTDFVAGSSATFKRNPNYWAVDPVGPGRGNKLPYVDEVKVLIIPDASTREAAIRTGKIDRISLNWEMGPVLMKQVPALVYSEGGRSAAAQCTGWRTDKAPFNDKRVRRALMMAIDWDGIKVLYGGDPLLLTWPIGYLPDYKNAYLGLDDPEMPESVKELYVYNPEKAKKLLAEAGYPNGFKTSVICTSDTTVIDYYSVIANSWSKIGVQLSIEPRDTGTWNSIIRSRNYDQMVYGSCPPTVTLYRCLGYWGETLTNVSMVNDPYIDQVRAQMQKAVLTSQAEADKIHKELMKYVLDQAWAIPYPSPISYTFWWPWIKNYHGEASLGYFNDPAWTMYVWVDQDMKKSMGY